MRKRLTMAIAAGALVAPMVPAVASAAKPQALAFAKLSDGCGVVFVVSQHWDANFNPSQANADLRAIDCRPPSIVRAGAVRPRGPGHDR